ncbi:aldehyde dehydrogenase [Mycolicibacterium flavescens]|uniref:Aldehyde dehydrogenase n=1 Tax=Mycolicibacterium flavescens TaxID=1776 RepID=A0A1E3RLU9_MYCFV|nr:aldehyde dehydrogenase family protein [Mycolicibacterium flavescens]MCV7281771.1 aldehyde dehydrogenase [Mycolicibacterium flavescens]ODQ90839.1 aldehyde dehydrogenase [Mycolicibacterium flavescens]
MTTPPVDVLPDPALLIGEDRLTTSSGGTLQHRYAATGQTTREFPLAGAQEVDRAVQAARAAVPVWTALPRDQRRRLLWRVAELLRENAEELALMSVVENGMPLMLATHNPAVTADLFEYNAGWADKVGGAVEPSWPVPALDYSTEEPYGVVGVIIPWNGPLASIGMVVAPALTAGNCVVLKPPELTPWTSLRFGELVAQAGFPPGVLNVVPGGPEAGEALTRHPGIDKLHFTGSGLTARHVLAGAQQNLTPVSLELGGKSANLVFADADLPAAVQQAVGGLVQLSGQTCLCGTRLIVEDSVYDDVVQMTASFLDHVQVGDPLDPQTVMGPVVSATAADRIMGVVERARGESRLVTGGTRLDGDYADGYFIAPTVFADVDNGSHLAQNEVFGPVLSIMRFSDTEDAVRLANDTPYGLAAYIWSSDLQRTHRVAAQLQAGNIWVNGFFGIPPSMPFGGVKQSGFGRIGGRDGIREFTRPKNVWIAL